MANVNQAKIYLNLDGTLFDKDVGYVNRGAKGTQQILLITPFHTDHTVVIKYDNNLNDIISSDVMLPIGVEEVTLQSGEKELWNVFKIDVPRRTMSLLAKKNQNNANVQFDFIESYTSTSKATEYIFKNVYRNELSLNDNLPVGEDKWYAGVGDLYQNSSIGNLSAYEWKDNQWIDTLMTVEDFEINNDISRNETINASDIISISVKPNIDINNYAEENQTVFDNFTDRVIKNEKDISIINNKVSNIEANDIQQNDRLSILEQTEDEIYALNNNEQIGDKIKYGKFNFEEGFIIKQDPDDNNKINLSVKPNEKKVNCNIKTNSIIETTTDIQKISFIKEIDFEENNDIFLNANNDISTKDFGESLKNFNMTANITYRNIDLTNVYNLYIYVYFNGAIQEEYTETIPLNPNFSSSFDIIKTIKIPKNTIVTYNVQSDVNSAIFIDEFTLYGETIANLNVIYSENSGNAEKLGGNIPEYFAKAEDLRITHYKSMSELGLIDDDFANKSKLECANIIEEKLPSGSILLFDIAEFGADSNLIINFAPDNLSFPRGVVRVTKNRGKAIDGVTFELLERGGLGNGVYNGSLDIDNFVWKLIVNTEYVDEVKKDYQLKTYSSLGALGITNSSLIPGDVIASFKAIWNAMPDYSQLIFSPREFNLGEEDNLVGLFPTKNGTCKIIKTDNRSLTIATFEFAARTWSTGNSHPLEVYMGSLDNFRDSWSGWGKLSFT